MLDEVTTQPSAKFQDGAKRLTPYGFYALAVLIMSNFLNYVDRNILSIVAESVKHDLTLTDAQLGFLMGTAFAVLYGVIGIPMGRVSDAMSRTGLMGIAMAFWSLMTAVAGFASGFGTLAAARVGVGLGEAAASPCSHSLLTDYFPRNNRAAVLGLYLVGTYAGMGCSLYFGGLILQDWSSVCHRFPFDACSFSNWQAAFLVVGFPGLVVAFLVYGLREPLRPGVKTGGSFARLFTTEMSTVVPPFTMLALYRAGNRGLLTYNALMLAAVTCAAVVLGLLSGDWLQWISVATGVYCVGSWVQALSARDRPTYALTFGCPTFISFVFGCALVGAVGNTVQVWAAPFAMRQFGMSPAEAGLRIGLTFAVAAALGVSLGGIWTDRWKRIDSRAPVWTAVISLVGPIIPLWTMLYTGSQAIFIAAFFFFGLIGMGWAGAAAAVAQDLVLPRMRGSAAASLALVVLLTSLSIGPYLVGKVSSLTGSLRFGLLSLQLLIPLALFLLVKCAGRLRHENSERRASLARNAGEPVGALEEPPII